MYVQKKAGANVHTTRKQKKVEYTVNKGAEVQKSRELTRGEPNESRERA